MPIHDTASLLYVIFFIQHPSITFSKLMYTVGKWYISSTVAPHVFMKRRDETTELKSLRKPPQPLCQYRVCSSLIITAGLVGYRHSEKVEWPSALRFCRVGSCVSYHRRIYWRVGTRFALLFIYHFGSTKWIVHRGSNEIHRSQKIIVSFQYLFSNMNILLLMRSCKKGC